MNIADSLEDNGLPVLEIGPGTGALTQHLHHRFQERLSVCEIDERSIAFLHRTYPNLTIYDADFLQFNIPKHFPNGVNIIGNYPYNISSQIVFKVLENRSHVPQCCGMFQKEVAERICANPGQKQYGQLTVLRALDYTAEYLFTVQKDAFDPPPKVQSGVICLRSKSKSEIDENKKQFIQFVKQAFSQRRKKLRNSVKMYFSTEELQAEIFDLRPEQLSLSQFLDLFHSIAQE